MLFLSLPIVIGEEDEINDLPFYSPTTLKTGYYYRNYLLNFDIIIQPSTIIVHIECFEKYGYYDETGVLIDWDLYLRFSKHIDFYCINEFLSNYHVSPLGITQGGYAILGDKAGNDILKLFLKWQKEIKKSKEA